MVRVTRGIGLFLVSSPMSGTVLSVQSRLEARYLAEADVELAQLGGSGEHGITSSFYVSPALSRKHTLLERLQKHRLKSFFSGFDSL